MSFKLLDYIQYCLLSDQLPELILSLLPGDVELGCRLCHEERSYLFHDGDTEISKLDLPDGTEELLPVSPYCLEGGHCISEGGSRITDKLVEICSAFCNFIGLVANVDQSFEE